MDLVGKLMDLVRKGSECDRPAVKELLRRSNKVQWSSLLRVMEEAAKQR